MIYAKVKVDLLEEAMRRLNKSKVFERESLLLPKVLKMSARSRT